MSRKETEKGAASRMCHFLAHPFPECYCMQITGSKIGRILTYCSDDYASCAIYRSRTGSEQPAGTQSR